MRDKIHRVVSTKVVGIHSTLQSGKGRRQALVGLGPIPENTLLHDFLSFPELESNSSVNSFSSEPPSQSHQLRNCCSSGETYLHRTFMQTIYVSTFSFSITFLISSSLCSNEIFIRCYQLRRPMG